MGSILCYDKNVALKDIMLTLKKKKKKTHDLEVCN